MVKEIICSGGEIALCDDEDYPLLSRHAWAYQKSKKKPYVVTGNTCDGHHKNISMHNMILGLSETVDHIDGNTLHNYKENLRKATKQENGWNAKKMARCAGKKPPTSKYKGVSYTPLRGRDRWIVLIKHVENGKHKSTGKTLRCGYFWDETEAARAYNKKIVELRGEFAWVNPLPAVG